MDRLEDTVLAELLRIRHFETALLELFAEGAISGTVHTCLGQEYIPVALQPLISGALVFSNHRGHGHYLAGHPSVSDAAGLLAEIMGRVGAVCGGVGGSQHVYRENAFLSTGVQGESLPVAVGAALHERRAGSGRLVVAYIGDGTWGEGSVYEALNLAALWQVPLCVVVENNGIAQTTPTHVQMAGSIRDRVRAFGIAYEFVADDDVTAIRAQLGRAVERARSAPLVIEFATRRLGPHSKGDDTRDEATLDDVRARDWGARYQAAYPEQFDRVDAAQRVQTADIVAQVRARPPVSAAVPAPGDGE